MNLLGLYWLLFFFSAQNFVCSVSLGGIVKTLHKGVDEVVKGTIKGATEVVGKPVGPEDVKFYLITSQDTEGNNTIDQYAPKNVAQTNGNLFFFVHGWTQSRTSCPWYVPLTKVLLQQHPDSHIVQVDWSKTASDNFASAAFSTESVGQIIANVIQKLVKENGVSLEKIVIIGHSLGSQIAGWVGKGYRQLTNESLPKIIALDPAGPIFDVRPDSRRLNKHDADVVMAVHTDRGKFGYPTNCGTIDFFPNNGCEQPGCLKLSLTDLSSLSLTDPLWCSHRRAHDLFIEAVKQPQGFMSSKCENHSNFQSHKCDENQKVSMGDWQTSATGSFYLETSGEAPFIKAQHSPDTGKS